MAVNLPPEEEVGSRSDVVASLTSPCIPAGERCALPQLSTAKPHLSAIAHSSRPTASQPVDVLDELVELALRAWVRLSMLFSSAMSVR